jgi:ketosteroid isomerase-like protein/TolB-like protein
MSLRLKSTIAAATILFSFFVALTLYPETMVIAIYDFDARGLSKQTASIVTEWVRTAISNSDYRIVDRSRMGTIMKEQGLQMSGLADPDKAVKVGRMLAANKILVGTVTKLGKKYIVSGRLIDIERGSSEFGHQEFTWRLSDLDMCAQRFVDNILLKMSGQFTTGTIASIAPPKSGSDNKRIEEDKITKTIRALYDSYINKDLDAYVSVIDDNARFWCSSYDLRGKEKIRLYRKNRTFVYLDDFEYELKNIEIRVNGDSATVYDTYILKYTVKKSGKRVTESARERFKLIKKGNSWYIVENEEF